MIALEEHTLERFANLLFTILFILLSFSICLICSLFFVLLKKSKIISHFFVILEINIVKYKKDGEVSNNGKMFTSSILFLELFFLFPLTWMSSFN